MDDLICPIHKQHDQTKVHAKHFVNKSKIFRVHYGLQIGDLSQTLYMSLDVHPQLFNCDINHGAICTKIIIVICKRTS